MYSLFIHFMWAKVFLLERGCVVVWLCGRVHQLLLQQSTVGE